VEDGGLYLAGVKRLLDPTLYPRQTAFVVEHLRFSIFAPVVAAMVRGSRLRVETVMLFLYFATIWITLFAAWNLVVRCYEDRVSRTGAVALLATWLTLPIAGTSLMLMDPYVTARSISTPCTLWALAGALDFLSEDGSRRRRLHGLLLAGCALIFGLFFHPLMTAYAVVAVLVLATIQLSKTVWTWTAAGICVAAVTAAALPQALSVPESSDYVHVAMTRTYWFLSQWHWYERLGLAAPLLLLARMARRQVDWPARLALTRMSLTVGLASTVVALLFAHVDSTSHLIARLQPLRSFQLIYMVMFLFVGAEVSGRLLRRHAIRWTATFAVLAAVMLAAERQIFPNSAHIEFPEESARRVEKNPWVRAFLWVRGNTPKGALLALDADYIEKQGEDAQCFRAIAERSALPDYSKDGGEASITPSLTKAWVQGESAQTKLSAETDEERVSALTPLGVDWVVLEKSAVTGFACDYANEAVKVCRMPETLNRTIVSSQSPASRPSGMRR